MEFMETNMPNTGGSEKMDPRIAKEKRIGTEKAEALDLGKEIDQELRIEENPGKALEDFDLSAEWQAFRPYENQAESESKEKIRDEALKSLSLIEKNLDPNDPNIERYQKLLENYRESLNRGIGNA